MTYRNPVIKGFYPDPSVCCAYGKYYLAASSFQYFPGVPLFESDDLVNWTQIGFALTRPEQVMLDKIGSSGGVFAPTLRFHNGRFYLVTTNDTTHENFYVWTDDIYGEWSDPITVDQSGIDPSLLFDEGKVYFLSNGEDDSGVSGVVQCEIDILTGRKLTPSRCIWQGSGGRFLESPHMYNIDGIYYLMAAEGGTEYGHMITCARSDSPWGHFESCPRNPVLTNRNKAPYIIQGIGHGDLIQDKNGNRYILCLGFRQIHRWMTFHHLGREVFLVPVTFGNDGWFTAGHDGTCDEYYDIEGDFPQEEKRIFTFENTLWNVDWQYLRKPVPENYIFDKDRLTLKGTNITLDDTDSPTFICMHQRDFCFRLRTKVSIDAGEAGLTLYHCETEHYDIAVRRTDKGFEAVLRLNIGGIKHEQATVYIPDGSADISVAADNLSYVFMVNGLMIGSADTKYLSSEVCGGFTGTVIGLYATGQNTADFTDYEIKYE
ncbi:MAG: glycoside hydrolase family 43 protein [Ruminiclostridium sp.]|nr:glycoside hydrolase family 43 protein [Ruminiclostridium sp.]